MYSRTTNFIYHVVTAEGLLAMLISLGYVNNKTKPFMLILTNRNYIKLQK